MDALGKILLFSFNFGLVSAAFCYSSYGYTYCSGYCSGYLNQYCNNYYSYYYNYYYYYNASNESISVGTIAGIIIGSIIGLVIIITIIVAICAACTKTAGTRGRVIHTMNPSGGIAVLHSGTNETRFYNGMPSAPPYSHPPVTDGASYPQQLSADPPPPPSNTANNFEQQVPPPSYSILS